MSSQLEGVFRWKEEGTGNFTVQGDETAQGSGVQELLYVSGVLRYMRGALITAQAADIDADVDIRHDFLLHSIITSVTFCD